MWWRPQMKGTPVSGHAVGLGGHHFREGALLLERRGAQHLVSLPQASHLVAHAFDDAREVLAYGVRNAPARSEWKTYVLPHAG
jgi:hypothetical protein